MTWFFSLLPLPLVCSLFHEIENGAKKRTPPFLITRPLPCFPATFEEGGVDWIKEMGRRTISLQFLCTRQVFSTRTTIQRVDVYNGNCVSPFSTTIFFRSVKMKITQEIVSFHCWFLRNAAKMELVRYDCDYRAHTARSKFAKGMLLSAFFRVWRSLSLSPFFSRY